MNAYLQSKTPAVDFVSQTDSCNCIASCWIINLSLSKSVHLYYQYLYAWPYSKDGIFGICVSGIIVYNHYPSIGMFNYLKQSATLMPGVSYTKCWYVDILQYFCVSYTSLSGWYPSLKSAMWSCYVQCMHEGCWFQLAVMLICESFLVHDLLISFFSQDQDLLCKVLTSFIYVAKIFECCDCQSV